MRETAFAAMTAVTAITAFAASALLTGLVRKFALARGVLDLPNERSSHSAPTPRGGGLSIVLVATGVEIALSRLGILRGDLFAAVAGGGIAVAAVGFIDDRYGVSARIRLTVHCAAALWALACLGGLPPLRVGDHLLGLGRAGYVVGALGIVWTLNLFNFMDGIDGIAASEAIFISWGGALFAVALGVSAGVSALCFAIGAACLGFLLWNWPPARIFMGDVGSGYLGYVVGVLALAATRENPSSLWIWLILGGAFFVDATVTLVRRLANGERIEQAHRSHAYQWLARRWKSHLRVTGAMIILNLAWLMPCAILAARYPSFADWIAAGALVPLAGLALAAGAGRREQSVQIESR